MSADLATRPETEVRITDVIVGDRARKDYGDLTSLMESIREHGLLQPIGVLPGNRLLFGGRRLEACRLLGHECIAFVVPQTQDDAVALHKAERDENTCRKDMTPSEKVGVAQVIEEMERPKGRERQADAGRMFGRGSNSSGTVDPKQTDEPYRRSSDVAAEAVGMSRKTYERAALVSSAAADPELPDHVRVVAQEAKAGMDAGTLSIKGAQHKVNTAIGRSVESTAPAHAKTDPQESAVTPAPKRPGPKPTRHVIKVANIRRILTRVDYDDALTGITAADPALTNEEAARMTGDLSKSIAALQRLNRLIKERTK